MAAAQQSIFITGGSGYIGSRLIVQLLKRGHRVIALSRVGSQHKIPAGCELVIGDALDANSFSNQIGSVDTWIQLIGVAHPGPFKARQFREIDLVSAQTAIEAAGNIGVKHFIYLSVAQPAPIMKAYIAVRAETEKLIRLRGLNATILRPWYVLGPQHWWPLLLLPAYWLLERLPTTRELAKRLQMVTITQMLTALVHAVEHPAQGIKVVSAEQISLERLEAE